jgi:metal-responsive CopG/Arc/MetJ family transcriptional regulator
VFLYAHKNKPSLQKLQEAQLLKKEQMFSKTQNVSDKIKNEIIPLLGSDEDIDELDDEVAMISNKKSATASN